MDMAAHDGRHFFFSLFPQSFVPLFVPAPSGTLWAQKPPGGPWLLPLVRDKGCWGGRSPRGMEKKVRHLLPTALCLPVGRPQGRMEGRKKGRKGKREGKEEG